MVALNPADRPTCDQLINCNWFRQPSHTPVSPKSSLSSTPPYKTLVSPSTPPGQTIQSLDATTVTGQPPSPYAFVRQRYPNWKTVGKQYLRPIPKDQPLLFTEKKFAELKGIKFGKLLGSGGYGQVYECEITKPLSCNRSVYPTGQLAVKIVSLKDFDDKIRTPYEALKKMIAEYRLHCKLEHDNIVSSIDMFGIHDPDTQFPCIRHLHFMELCNGNLVDLLNLFITMSELYARIWFRHICQGLRYLHSWRICHLDIKCLNILYKGFYMNSVFKLADYGLAGYISEICGTFGTDGYMAPELNNKTKVNTFPCDIWSLGVTLCETLGGVHNDVLVRDALSKLTDQSQFAAFKGNTSYKIDTYEFCQMINSMVALNPADRPTCDQLIDCNWFRQP
ncbi:uncharacterized protein LOC128954075 [Oppia nitens]|uniref:uncharacterized protein LOC128954075 n=1 Tax=Oppia nitens TaxID=1686743 RepID=UPI0023D9F01D|nr:uncharacterized protein LOC128954075 [Oppia nitens]